VYNLLLFHYNSGCKNAPQIYVIRTVLPVLFLVSPRTVYIPMYFQKYNLLITITFDNTWIELLTVLVNK